MAFTVIFINGVPRDYGVLDSFEVTDAGVLLIEMKREDVQRHYVAPGGWLEVVEMADGHSVKMTRGIIGHRPKLSNRDTDTTHTTRRVRSPWFESRRRPKDRQPAWR